MNQPTEPGAPPRSYGPEVHGSLVGQQIPETEPNESEKEAEAGEEAGEIAVEETVEEPNRVVVEIGWKDVPAEIVSSFGVHGGKKHYRVRLPDGTERNITEDQIRNPQTDEPVAEEAAAGAEEPQVIPPAPEVGHRNQQETTEERARREMEEEQAAQARSGRDPAAERAQAQEILEELFTDPKYCKELGVDPKRPETRRRASELIAQNHLPPEAVKKAFDAGYSIKDVLGAKWVPALLKEFRDKGINLGELPEEKADKHGIPDEVIRAAAEHGISIDYLVAAKVSPAAGKRLRELGIEWGPSSESRPPSPEEVAQFNALKERVLANDTDVEELLRLIHKDHPEVQWDTIIASLPEGEQEQIRAALELSEDPQVELHRQGYDFLEAVKQIRVEIEEHPGRVRWSLLMSRPGGIIPVVRGIRQRFLTWRIYWNMLHDREIERQTILQKREQVKDPRDVPMPIYDDGFLGFARRRKIKQFIKKHDKDLITESSKLNLLNRRGSRELGAERLAMAQRIWKLRREQMAFQEGRMTPPGFYDHVEYKKRLKAWQRKTLPIKGHEPGKYDFAPPASPDEIEPQEIVGV